MISIIVPIYNVGRYLPQCIDSIIQQTFSDIEIILVDDGSVDHSGEICDEYALKDSRIVVIHKKNGGLVSARKAGIAVARGEYVGFVDGDDWIEPRMYEHLMDTAMKEQADLVLGGSIEDAGGQAIYKTNRLNPGIYERERLREELYPNMLCAENFFCMGVLPYLWNKLMRYDLAYPNIMAVDERIRVGEDVAAVMPMLLQADKVVITDYCDYHYCIRGTSMMWEHESKEKEWNELGILHCFLQSALARYKNYNLIHQLNHYTVGNMLTRAYDLLAGRDGEGILWPFGYRVNRRKCILYSAGNFGRAVYGYLQNCYPDIIELWVDKEYQLYQAMGLPVHSVEQINLEKEADVLVAILNMQLADFVRDSLIQRGMCREHIYCINITEEDVSRILESMGKAGGETGGTKHLHSRCTFKGANTWCVSYKDRA